MPELAGSGAARLQGARAGVIVAAVDPAKADNLPQAASESGVAGVTASGGGAAPEQEAPVEGFVEATGPVLLGLFDPGWLMLIAGVVLISVTVILPAQRELEQAKFFKSRVDAIARHRSERLANYAEYISALDRGEPAVVEALAARQKNMAREGLEVILPARPDGGSMASTFPQLEPAPLKLPEPVKIDPATLSSIERWSTDEKTRPIVLLTGGVLILLGLLPWGRMFSRQAVG
jgi:hypothetical protein